MVNFTWFPGVHGNGGLGGQLDPSLGTGHFVRQFSGQCEAEAAGQLWMNPGQDVLRPLCLPGPTVPSMLTLSDSAGWWPLPESLVKGGTV